MWCVCVVAGAGWGTPASSACRWPGTSCRVSLSRLGVGSGPVVSLVLDCVCPVESVGGGWDSIARGPCLGVLVCCVVGVCLERGCVWSLHCVLLRRPFGDEVLLLECAHVLGG
ncbi:hypothetical protein AMECASPLE_022936 [Ameca splendens]|uniref:Secreted protein n=1 Tax=Ameca splendens TaxID=208324 RepID=A0ABV1ABX5_9TELE